MLTRLQKYALAAFVLLMSADLVISSYGVLFFPAFTEANALFARFVEYPLKFIAVVGVTKLLVIAGIIAATIWFNRRERARQSLARRGYPLLNRSRRNGGDDARAGGCGNLLFV